MDTFLYSCHYCGKEYQPKRRYKQRFCSNSCRVNSFNHKKQTGLSIAQKKDLTKKPIKIEKMSIAGFANATVGVVTGKVAVNRLSSILTSEENKPTKKNVAPSHGYDTFYDMQTQSIVYHKKK